MPNLVASPARKGPMNMRELARQAGVSTATVSRVLHNSPKVDPATAQRVRQVIERFSYVPSSMGISLKSGRSGVIGLILPDLANPFFADFVRHFEGQIVAREQEMMLAISEHSSSQMQQCIRRMLQRGVDGIVMLESEIATQSYETVLHNLVPLVTMNRLLVEPGVSDVAIDSSPGTSAAVAHLCELGHTRIAFLGGIAGQRIAIARREAFRKAMTANGLESDETLIVDARFSFEGGLAAMCELLQLDDRPTAALCANDVSAFGAMRALADRGLVAGKDFSIVGLDDVDLCRMIHPYLTTLRLSREQLARLCFTALDKLFKAPHRPGVQLVLETELVLRETTGPRVATETGSRIHRAK